MRWFLLIVIGAVAVWYFTMGVRLGLVPQTSASIWNADGLNVYPISVRTNDSRIIVDVDAAVRSGATRMELFAPGHRSIWRVKLEPGQSYKESKSLTAPAVGFYRMELEYQRATGNVGLSWLVTNF